MERYTYMDNSHLDPKQKEVEDTSKTSVRLLIELGLMKHERCIEVKNLHSKNVNEIERIAKKKYSSIINQGGTVKVLGTGTVADAITEQAIKNRAKKEEDKKFRRRRKRISK